MDKLTLKLAVLSLLAMVVLPMAVHADPPPWAPAHGYRAKHYRDNYYPHQYRYIYYPRYNVYYAPQTQLWFWLGGGRWRVGASLPGSIVVAGAPGVSIVLGTERPYEENAYVVEHYGWRHHRHYEQDEDEDD